MNPNRTESSCPESARWKRWIAVAAASLALIAATRWPLAPTGHLYHIDNVNFALALDDFNPALDQPQPPGDPLYVALTRWMRRFAPRVEILFPLSGILGSAAAMAALWWTGEMLFGARAGWLAALLLALNPIFWLAGVGNYVRVYLALGAAVVAGLVWKSLDGSAAYFCASAAALGLFAGFRPEMGLLLAPLVFAPAWMRRAPLWQWLAAAGCAAAATLPWLLITAQHSGGLAVLYRLNSGYLAMQSRHSSWLYGASFVEGLRMAAASVYWNLLGALAWIAFVPLAWKRLHNRRAARCLALWFAPPFLFYTFVHIHNPDHALVAIPATCLAGAWVMSELSARWFRWAAPAAFTLSVFLFFYPARSPFWASNYRIAEYTMRSAEQVYARIGELEKQGPVTVLWRNGYITAREIGYYYPRAPILDLDFTPAQLQIGNRLQPAASGGSDLLVRAGRIVWIDPVSAAEAGAFEGLRQAAGGESRSDGPVHWADLPAGARFQAAGQWIRVTDRNATMSSTRP